jgi:dGTPase
MSSKDNYLMECFKADSFFACRDYKKEKEHPHRSKFQRDRDRILYSKAFRRLKGKTQIFTTDNEDHLRTRLTHTLEVSQISTTISQILGLNIFLTEAIALGHDIGHTPFGHFGEDILKDILTGKETMRVKDCEYNKNLKPEDKGFKHNWQSIRVLTNLERKTSRYNGLNLTDYTLWGILNHTGLSNAKNTFYIKREFNSSYYRDIFNDDTNKSWTLEGLIVRQADEIAQRHHDLEDGIIAEILDRKGCIRKFWDCYKDYLDKTYYHYLLNEIKTNVDASHIDYFLYPFSRIIIDLYVMNLIENTWENLSNLSNKYNISNSRDFHEKKETIFHKEGKEKILCLVDFNDKFKQKEEDFKKFLIDSILNSYYVHRMNGKSGFIIRELFKAYLNNPQQLPNETIIYMYRFFHPRFLKRNLLKGTKICVSNLRDNLSSEKKNNRVYYRICLLRTVADYISGMTDNYALKQFQQLYYPAFLPI